MNKRTKIKISSLMLIPFVLTGCENKTEEEIEVTDEFLISDSDDNKDNLNKEENNGVIEEKDKEESNIDDELKESNDNKNVSNKQNLSQINDKNTSESSNKENTVSQTVQSTIDDIVLDSNPIFTKSEIPEHIKQKMLGNSMTEDATVSFDELSYLTISHVDYNGKTQQGEMIVNAKLADEVLDIFRDIYNAKFPIEKIKLIDEYGASDHKSMVDNNSSAFCYRTIAGTSKVSNHGLGVAIDINPFYNPHVLKSKGTVNPPEASKYADRTLNDKGMIKKNDAVYKAFTSRGWKWGGNWNNPDYQHFEKSI